MDARAARQQDPAGDRLHQQELTARRRGRRARREHEHAGSVAGRERRRRKPCRSTTPRARCSPRASTTDVGATSERFVIAAAEAFVASAKMGRSQAVTAPLRRAVDGLSVRRAGEGDRHDRPAARDGEGRGQGARDREPARHDRPAEILSPRTLLEILKGSNTLGDERRQSYLKGLSKVLECIQSQHFDSAISFLPESPARTHPRTAARLHAPRRPRLRSQDRRAVRQRRHRARPRAGAPAGVDGHATPPRKPISMASQSPHPLVRIEALGHIEGVSGVRVRTEMRKLLDDDQTRGAPGRAQRDGDSTTSRPPGRSWCCASRTRRSSKLPLEEREQSLQTLSKLRPKRCEEVCIALLKTSQAVPAGVARDDARARGALSGRGREHRRRATTCSVRSPRASRGATASACATRATAALAPSHGSVPRSDRAPLNRRTRRATSRPQPAATPRSARSSANRRPERPVSVRRPRRARPAQRRAERAGGRELPAPPTAAEQPGANTTATRKTHERGRRAKPSDTTTRPKDARPRRRGNRAGQDANAVDFLAACKATDSRNKSLEEIRDKGADVDPRGLSPAQELARARDRATRPVQTTVKETHGIISDFASIVGGYVSITYVEDTIFVCGQLLRASRSIYESAMEVGKMLAICGVSEVQLHRRDDRSRPARASARPSRRRVARPRATQPPARGQAHEHRPCARSTPRCRRPRTTKTCRRWRRRCARMLRRWS